VARQAALGDLAASVIDDYAERASSHLEKRASSDSSSVCSVVAAIA
jgi:hypothetical protein